MSRSSSDRAGMTSFRRHTKSKWSRPCRQDQTHCKDLSHVYEASRVLTSPSFVTLILRQRLFHSAVMTTGLLRISMGRSRHSE